MKSKLLSPETPSGNVPAAPGDLFQYNLKTASYGEVVMLTRDGSAVVIHSAWSAYPVGHVYPEFRVSDPAWQRLPSATIAYTS